MSGHEWEDARLTYLREAREQEEKHLQQLREQQERAEEELAQLLDARDYEEEQLEQRNGKKRSINSDTVSNEDVICLKRFFTAANEWSF